MSHNMLPLSRQGQVELTDAGAIFTHVAMMMLKPGKLLNRADPLLINVFIKASLGRCSGTHTQLRPTIALSLAVKQNCMSFKQLMAM